jgi:hypothetical protein
MDLTEGPETSAKLNLTPGKYPKENIQVSEHGENLQSRKRQLSALPNIGPYIYIYIDTTVKFLALQGAPYIYDISRLSFKGLTARRLCKG